MHALLQVGRVASHYYIHHESIEKYNGMLKARMTDEEVGTTDDGQPEQGGCAAMQYASIVM